MSTEARNKLVLAILQGDDYADTVSELTHHGFFVTLLNTTGGEGRVLLVQGVLQKDGWFTWGEEMCHVAANGLIHSIVPLVDTATCLTNGQLKATCTECGDVYRGQATWAKGHTWGESYVCTVCGTQGTDIANATLTVQYAYYSYTGNAIRPYSEATYNGTKLAPAARPKPAFRCGYSF